MRFIKILKSTGFLAVSVAVVGVSLSAVQLSSGSRASAQTSGIVTSSLALNLDPNLGTSYSGSGTTVTDLSAGGRNGTLAGNPLPTFDDTSPKSFVFAREPIVSTNSTAGKISIDGNFLTEDFTIQTWIKTNQVGYSTAHYTTMFIMASECGGGADDWGMGINNSGQLAFGVGPSDTTFATSEAVNTNNWVNVAASRERTSGEIKLYINGVLKMTNTGHSGNTLNCSSDQKTWIGNGQDGPAYSFGGKISSVLAYTRALSSTDVLANYNATLDTFYPVTYTITYDANGATSGTIPSAGSFTSGSAATTVASNSGSLVRTGYTFAGWNTAANGTGTSFAAGTSTYSSRADVTLYAMWTPIPTTTTTAPPTTTTQPPAVVIDIQAPVSTVAIGQASVATIAPRRATTSTSTPARSSSETSAAVTTTTAAPLKTQSSAITPPNIPEVATGETALDVDGVSTKVDVTRENNQLVVKSGSIQAVLSGLDVTGETRALDSDGNLRLNAGDVVQINLGGFMPDSDVEVWLFSTPTRLGTAVVGSDGRVTGSFAIPEDLESGSHRIAVTAKLPDGKSATFTLGIAVGEIAKTSTLTRVLIAIPIAIAIGLGLILPNRLRRRRSYAEEPSIIIE